MLNLGTLLVYGSWALAALLAVVGAVSADRGRGGLAGGYILLASALVILGYLSTGGM